MNVSSPLEINHVQPGDHVVQFYERESELVESVGSYLCTALRGEDSAVVIATPAHRDAFLERLRVGDIDIAAAVDAGQLHLLDAETTLATLMPGDRIERDAFREVIGGVIESARRDGRPVCAYGEMVALAWDAGNVLAAIELETLWNELAQDLPFTLYCAYRSDAVAGHEHADALHEVCGLHASVVHPSPGAGEVSVDLPVDPGAAAYARHMVADAVREWGHTSTLIADAELITTELATNAIRHAGTPFRVSVQRFGPAVRISVHDSAPAMPAVLEIDDACLSGRGMHLIGAIARRWGVEVTSDGKAVWAEIGR